MTQKIQQAGRRIRTERLRTGFLSAVATMVGLLGVTTSCIFDSVTDDDGDYGSDTTTVGISIRMMSTGNVTDIQTGTLYENYVGDYAIYFFTNEDNTGGTDTFITGFDPIYFTAIDDELFTTYSVFGKVPDEMIDKGSFKVVVLANWGTYPTPDATTTIESLCRSGTFAHKESFTLGSDNLIPMYGVQEYSGVTFKANRVTTLDDPINLLRAMAKVEVVLDNSDLIFDSVVLHRYNDEGYCAPSGVYKCDDYATYSATYGWQYKADVIGLHLIDGANDADQTGHTLDMQFALNDSGKNTWYCYVPEYDNTSDEDDYAYIQLNLSGYTDAENEPYRIYFRDYDSNGDPEDGTDYDIGRNVLYRFTVTLTGRWLNVHVDKWEDSFWNDFTFGDNTDDDGTE